MVLKRIPPKFVPQLANTAAGEGRRSSTATILSPLGKFWHVEVCRDGPEAGEVPDPRPATCWSSPSYEANMVFTLKVFDHSGCLKEHYNSSSSSSSSNNNSNVVPAVVDCRRPRRNRRHRHQHASGVAREGTMNNGEGPSLGRDPIETNLSIVEREEEEEEEEVEEEESPKMKEKLRNQKASKKNCYEKRMRLYNIEKYMIISKRFCTSHGLTASHKVVIKDSRRRS